MLDAVQPSIETAINPSVSLTVHMENIIKKYVEDKIACILPEVISATLKELNFTTLITSNIDTSNSVTISTITGEGNIATMQKDDTTVKEISEDNTNYIAISSQDPSSENDSSNPAGENNKVNDETQTVQTQKKLSTLTKSALMQ
eukprot:251205-Ditylum_brightwellii.AAC.1